MENTGNTETPQEEVEEIEAPTHLALQQNLYDQEPFTSLLASISDPRILAGVRHIIGTISSQIGRPTDVDPVELLRRRMEIRSREQDSYGYYLPREKRKEFSLTLEDIAKINQLTPGILRNLASYPDIIPYVQTATSTPSYNRDGRHIIPRDNEAITPPIQTYPEWVSQKQTEEDEARKRAEIEDRRAMQDVLREAFNQRAGDVARGTGVNRYRVRRIIR